MRRYEVGNEHMACQDISGNDVMISSIVYFKSFNFNDSTGLMIYQSLPN